MNSLDDMPRAASKKELFQLLRPISKKEAQEEAWEVICNNRNIPLQKAKKVRRLRKNEVRQLLINLGFLE